MHLDALVPPDVLAAAPDASLVRRRPHPTEPLHVYDYTAKAQFENRWDAATRTCRGLVVRGDTGAVVAPSCGRTAPTCSR